MEKNTYDEDKIMLYLAQEMNSDEAQEMKEREPRLCKKVRQIAQDLSDIKEAIVSPSSEAMDRILSHLRGNKSVEDQAHADKTHTY